MEEKESQRDAVFLRISPDLKRKWVRMCLDRNILQTTAGEALVDWIVRQHPLIQAAVFKQIPFTQELLSLLRSGFEGGDAEPPPAGVRPPRPRPPTIPGVVRGDEFEKQPRAAASHSDAAQRKVDEKNRGKGK